MTPPYNIFFERVLESEDLQDDAFKDDYSSLFIVIARMLKEKTILGKHDWQSKAVTSVFGKK